MKWGINLFATEYTMPPDELGREVEARGFESLWIAEHTHIPVARSDSRTLTRDYWHAYDPFLALVAAASSTARIRLGTGIVLVPQRDPIVTAKEVATLDRLCQGRFIFGIGAGWLREEIEDHGTEFKARFRLLRDRVRAMKAIWTEEKARYHGRFVSFDEMLSYPKPRQQPHPPIHMGGSGPRCLECVVAVCDGWMPNCPEGEWPRIKTTLEALRHQWEQAGRLASDLQVSIGAARAPAPEILTDMETEGVHRIILDVGSLPPDELRRQLDEHARLTG